MKKLILFSVYVLSTYLLLAQDPMLQQLNPLPVSPNAAAFTKYGDIPVSRVPECLIISIPIYTIATEAFNLPISLSYHAGGIKGRGICHQRGIGLGP